MGMTLKDAQRFFEIDVEFLEREIDDCKNTSRTKEFLGSRIEAESIAIQALIVADSGRPFETRGLGERMTNADRIRNMTDEELRDFINSIGYECRLACMQNGIECNIEICKDGILGWLKDEVSE